MKWEYFRDNSYYDLWAVRPVGENRWGYCFHVASNKEAEGLRDLLDKKETTGGEMNQTTDTKTSVEIVDCNDYVEDQRICYGGGEPKGQCVNCGFMWFNHRLELLPEEDRAAAERIQKGEMNQTTDTKTSEQLQPDNSCEHSFSPVYQCVHCGKIGDSIA